MQQRRPPSAKQKLRRHHRPPQNASMPPIRHRTVDSQSSIENAKGTPSPGFKEPFAKCFAVMETSNCKKKIKQERKENENFNIAIVQTSTHLELQWQWEVMEDEIIKTKQVALKWIRGRWDGHEVAITSG
jgi:hypothetical protein